MNAFAARELACQRCRSMADPEDEDDPVCACGHRESEHFVETLGHVNCTECDCYVFRCRKVGDED